MDTSAEYIEMCEKAKEILNNWHFAIGDEIGEYSTNHGYGYTGLLQVEDDSFVAKQYSLHPLGISGPIGILTVWLGKIIYTDLYFPLPRQDQIQKLYQKHTCSWQDLLKHFNLWLKVEVKSLNNYGSMEQLWLAFVMQEKYDKIWNGKDWVKS